MTSIYHIAIKQRNYAPTSTGPPNIHIALNLLVAVTYDQQDNLIYVPIDFTMTRIDHIAIKQRSYAPTSARPPNIHIALNLLVAVTYDQQDHLVYVPIDFTMTRIDHIAIKQRNYAQTSAGPPSIMAGATRVGVGADGKVIIKRLPISLLYVETLTQR